MFAKKYVRNFAREPFSPFAIMPISFPEGNLPLLEFAQRRIPVIYVQQISYTIPKLL
jgi:hypothetical protein